MSRFYALTLSLAIAVDVHARKAAFENVDTGVASVPTVAGSKCIGIFSEDTAAAYGMAPVQIGGVAPALFGGAAKINDSLTTDDQGRLVKAAGAAGTTVWCLGFSRSVITQADDEGDVLIHPHQVTV